MHQSPRHESRTLRDALYELDESINITGGKEGKEGREKKRLAVS